MKTLIFLRRLLAPHPSPQIALQIAANNRMSLPNQLNPTPQAKTTVRKSFNFENEDLWSTTRDKEEIETVEEIIVESTDIDIAESKEEQRQSWHNDKIITIDQFPLKIKKETIIPHPPRHYTKTNKKRSSVLHTERQNPTPRRRGKKYFCIGFRWPAKVYATVLSICCFAVLILQESRTTAAQLLKQAIEVNTSTASIDFQSIKLVATATKMKNYMVAAAVFASKQNESFHVVCKETKEICVQQWSQPTSTSISFNTSSFGWNNGIAAPHDEKEILSGLIVWSETAAWITDWQKEITTWTILFSIAMVLFTGWFMWQVVLNEKKGIKESTTNTT